MSNPLCRGVSAGLPKPRYSARPERPDHEEKRDEAARELYRLTRDEQYLILRGSK